MQILKVIARLMDYPTQEVGEHRHDLATAIADAREISPEMRARLLDTLQHIYDIPLLDAEESYCQLFEQGRSLSLLLFEHVHGESRDRGQAMVDLMEVYHSHDFIIDQRELPDYIPLFLEYLAHRPDMEAREWLADVSHILARLGARLLERESSYGHLFGALLMICAKSDVMAEEQQAIEGEERDDTIEAIDREWEEAAVTFSPAAEECDSKTSAQPPSPRPQPLNWVEPQSNQPLVVNKTNENIEPIGGQIQ